MQKFAFDGNIACGKTFALGGVSSDEWPVRKPAIDPRSFDSVFERQMAMAKEYALVQSRDEKALMDRSLLSVRAFTCLFREQKKLSAEEEQKVLDVCDGAPPVPVVFVRASARTCWERCKARARDMDKDHTLEFFEQLEKHFDAALASYKGPVCVVDNEEFGPIAHPLKLSFKYHCE